VLAAQERPAGVDGEDVLPHLERRVGRVGRRADAGHVDEHVEVAHRRRDGLLLAHVERQGPRPGAQVAGQRLDALADGVGQHDVAPLGVQAAGDGLADPRAGAGDERAPAVEAGPGHQAR
jgi:hypothetical protein